MSTNKFYERCFVYLQRVFDGSCLLHYEGTNAKICLCYSVVRWFSKCGRNYGGIGAISDRDTKRIKEMWS